ncbi:MAG: hypothetical protein J0H74_26305 [Chitinophagaceae bacterium]|nr:hypothetical protein [Chitinophagaceae bacterium]
MQFQKISTVEKEPIFTFIVIKAQATDRSLVTSMLTQSFDDNRLYTD